MEPRSVIVINEAKGNVNLYHIRVEVSGVPLWTGVYAESVERANRLAEKLFGKGNLRGRPTKVKESLGEAKLSSLKDHTDPDFVNQAYRILKASPETMLSVVNQMMALWNRTHPTEENERSRVAFSKAMHDKDYKKAAVIYTDYRVQNDPTVLVASVGEAKGPKKVEKGSQRREKIGFATDDPDKYVGKWEAYDEPQGVGTRAANVTMKPPKNESFDTPPGKFQRVNPSYVPQEGDDPVVYAARFVIEDMVYLAWMIKDMEHPGLHVFHFNTIDAVVADKNKYMRTGAGHPRKVFSTVLKIIKDALDSQDVPAVLFVGADPKQRLLYKRIIDRFGDNQIHSSYFRPRSFKYPVEDPVLQHKVLPLRDENLPERDKEEVSEEVTLDFSLSEGDSLGPAWSRGLNNSSSGRGALPPQTDFDPKDLSNVLRPRKKQPGAKAPTRKVEKTVSKSITDTVRKPNAKVTEMEITRLDELFGGGQTLPHQYEPDGYSDIEVGDETSVVVGFEDIQAYVPGAKPGVNAGFATMHEGMIMHGLDRESLNLDRRTLFALFNTVISIVERWVNDNRPDRVYFVAVEPMKNIYPRLIKKFVDSEEWKVSKGRKMIPMVGQELDIYMCERRSLEEMVRLPIRTKFNADYEVKDGEKTVGMATVNDGVIEKLMINQDEADETFKGQALSRTLGTIVRDADLQNANLAMQIVNLEDQDMKRYLERFGFRHVGNGVFKRTAGSITPPSVLEKKPTKKTS